MKKIKIFLASSITDLKYDRLEIGDFIRQLNDAYIDRDVYFSLIKCEDYDNSIVQEGKQAELDNEIANSELVFFLFFQKVGEYTRHEFDIALDAYRSKQTPKIVTYFKYVNSIDEVTGDVMSFMQMLDGEIKHYYNTYQCIDTLKLGMILQIKQLSLDAEEPKVKDGKVLFGDVEVCETKNVPLFACNESIEKLKQEIAYVDKRYYELQEKYLRDKSNDALFKKYCEFVRKKAELDEQLRLAEDAVLKVANDMTEKTAHGILSARQVAAYRALELGDYDGALAILDFDRIMEDIRHNTGLADVVKERLQVNVDEIIQRISIMVSDGVDKEETEELTGLYETAVELSEKYNLSKQPLLYYSEYLLTQNKTGKAIEIVERLYHYSELDKASQSVEFMLQVEQALATVYAIAEHLDKAEQYTSIALTHCLELVKQKPLLAYNLAQIYCNRALILFMQERYAEMHQVCLDGLKVLEPYVSPYFKRTCVYYWMLYGHLGTSYMFLKNYDEAEQPLLLAAEHLAEMSKQNKDYDRTLAQAYTNLGSMYKLKDMYDLAEQYCLKALTIQEELAVKNPEAYEKDLLTSYGFLANIYGLLGKEEEASKYIHKVAELSRRYYDDEPGMAKVKALGAQNVFYLVRDDKYMERYKEDYTFYDENDEEYEFEGPDLLDITLDEDNSDEITLRREDGFIMTFEQVAVIPHNEYIYLVLNPINLYGAEDIGVYIFRVDEREGEEPNAILVTGTNEGEEVYKEYLKLLEESEEDDDDEDDDD